jgi:hypothetical protein
MSNSTCSDEIGVRSTSALRCRLGAKCSLGLLITAWFLLAAPGLAYKYDLFALADSIQNVQIDFSRQAEVKGLTIERGGTRFVLQSGTLTLTRPVLGRVIAAVFVGKGQFTLVPPNSAEKFMFSKLCKDSVADWDFKELVFFATDSLMENLQQQYTFGDLKQVGSQQNLINGFSGYIEDEFEETFSALILPELLQSGSLGSFRARFKAPCGNLIFTYDLKEVEEVSLYKHTQTAYGAFPELISSFHSPEQYQESRWGPDHENKDVIDSLEYDINGKIWQSAKSDLQTKLSFLPNQDDLQSLRFNIFPDLMLESIRITNENGDSLFWQKIKKESGITVYFPQPLTKGKRHSILFSYTSKGMLEKTPWGNNVLVSSTSWYPSYGYLKRAKFRLTYACPEQYTFLSVGKKLSEKIEDGFKITSWDISDYPVAMISYNYGDFSLDTSSTPDGVPVDVYRSKAHLAGSSGMMERVLLDIRQSAALFSMELTHYPFPKLLATEIPSGHGQGLPGFLHLAWSTFESQLIPYDDAFRAHEVAHQWWGHLVGWQSYHDQWLSEGFAEYMGAWYVQRKYLNDEKYRGKFFELMDRWREDILQAGDQDIWGNTTAYREGNNAGPIWMGVRLATSKSADYTTLVYSKGAYVLYMLRMMMFDFNKRDDSKFNAMLKDFLEQYSWKEASTPDFIRVAEKHYGSKLDWFFDEWIYDNQVPTYRWSATATQEPDGRYVVNVDVQTDGVTPTFRMLVPFTVLMEGDYHTIVRLDIDQVNKRITLPKVPYKPTKFIFNPYRSVLCKDIKL